MNRKCFAAIAATAFAFVATHSHAQIAITGGGLTYAQDFDSLLRTTTAETWANNANTVSANDGPRLRGLGGWYTASYTNATYQSATYTPLIRAGDGSANTGSFYSYGTSGAADRALGTLPSDSTTASGAGSFRIGARFVNNTGETITGFTFTYDGEQWRKAQVTSAQNNQYVVSYAVFAPGTGTLDSGPYSANLAGATFNTPVDGGDNVGAALDGNNAANRVAGLGATVDLLTVAPGYEIWLRWFDSNSSSADQGIAIDNFNVTFAIPEPSSAALLGLGMMALLARRRTARR